MDKKSKITIITSIMALAIVTIIVTYAYFSARITGIESASTISLTAGTMGIQYSEGNEQVSLSNIYPKADPWVTKTFTLTGNNTTNQTMEYQVGLQITTNTFKGGQLSFSLEVGNSNVGTSMSPVTNKAITKTSGIMLIGKGSFPGPVTNGVQTYTLKIYFLDTGKDQNINQGAVFNAKITVGEKGSIVAVNECIDTAHPTPVQGDKYTNGKYIYKYMQALKYDKSTNNYAWENITDDGWGVFANNNTSTDPITTVLCTSINGKPIVSMSHMFTLSQAPSIDLSSFDTSNVTDMTGMFYYSTATSLDLSSFDTSSVTNMDSMFYSSDATDLDLSSFDTSNVTDMSAMFQGSDATSLDLSSFDTSNVTDMSAMFEGSDATSLDLSSFDTSNVTDMSAMFDSSAATSINVSSFDTSNVTKMSYMFSNSSATTLDLSSFDTSNVTDMKSMFQSSDATSLDLSSFDTSNVTDMSAMFSSSSATSLDLSSFDTSNVTDMSNMFDSSAATSINVSSFDTSNVTKMSYMFSNSSATTLDLSSFDTSNVASPWTRYMFQNSSATTGYARTQADADKFNSSINKPAELTFVVR